MDALGGADEEFVVPGLEIDKHAEFAIRFAGGLFDAQTAGHVDRDGLGQIDMLPRGQRILDLDRVEVRRAGDDHGV